MGENLLEILQKEIPQLDASCAALDLLEMWCGAEARFQAACKDAKIRADRANRCIDILKGPVKEIIRKVMALEVAYNRLDAQHDARIERLAKSVEMAQLDKMTDNTESLKGVLEVAAARIMSMEEKLQQTQVAESADEDILRCHMHLC